MEEKEEQTTEIVQIIASIIKTAPKATRQELSKLVRTDAGIWNSINGVGNTEENLPKGGIDGVVRSGSDLLFGVTVTAQQDGVDITSVQTDANGCYLIELDGGTYTVIYSLKDYNTETKDNEPVFPDVEMTKNVELQSVV